MHKLHYTFELDQLITHTGVSLLDWLAAVNKVLKNITMIYIKRSYYFPTRQVKGSKSFLCTK